MSKTCRGGGSILQFFFPGGEGTISSTIREGVKMLCHLFLIGVQAFYSILRGQGETVYLNFLAHPPTEMEGKLCFFCKSRNSYKEVHVSIKSKCAIFPEKLIYKMVLSVSIPCIPNYANLVVYPASKKVLLLKTLPFHKYYNTGGNFCLPAQHG